MTDSTAKQPHGGSAQPPALWSADDARAAILGAVVTPSATSAERVLLADAMGRVLACDVHAALSMPRWPNSAMDGYALRVCDLGHQPLPISQRVAAGSAPAPLEPGTAARIFTGAPVPEGADTVVMQEHCRLEGDRLVVQHAPARGANIRAAAEDFCAGDVVLEAGCHLQPQHIALAASAGAAKLTVHRRLRLGLLVTGDELAPPGAPLGPAQIHESNGHMLAALAHALGGEIATQSNLPDDEDVTRATLTDVAGDSDLVITSGGASVGDCDHVRRAVESVGELALFGIAVKPGKPLAFGRASDTPLLVLPGNPVSLFVTFLLFGAPLMRRLQGRARTMPDPLWVPAGFEQSHTHERADYVRARLENGRAVPCGAQGSGILTTTAVAEGLACIPAGTRVTPGEPLAYYPLATLLA